MGKTTKAAEAARIRTRQHPRCELRVDTKLELEDGREVTFQTSNISQSGFSGHTIEEAPVGSEVELHLPKIGSVAGEVVWQVGAALGARLNAELSMHEIMALKLDDLAGHPEPAPDAGDEAQPGATPAD